VLSVNFNQKLLYSELLGNFLIGFNFKQFNLHMLNQANFVVGRVNLIKKFMIKFNSSFKNFFVKLTPKK